LYVDAIKLLPGQVDEEHTAEELSDWLSQVYEHLLLYTVKADDAISCTLTLFSKSKKRLGNFYTPRDLAQFAVGKALHELVYEPSGELKAPEQILNLKVVDASMGSGMFLSAALEYLAQRLMESRMVSDLVSCRRDILRHCLYGVDLDQAAVNLARFLLALQCGASAPELERELATKLKCGDSLIGILPKSQVQASTIEDADQACNKFFGLAPDAENLFNYFHWALQFPDVFQGENSGFDAVLGNPPWEIRKPNSREFFQQMHGQYWSLGKQEALLKQHELRSQSGIDQEWNQYQDDYRLFSQWISKSGAYELQGSSDINSYKLFVELSLGIAKTSGVVALIVPASLYSDKGSLDLREALLQKNDWKFLHSFHNAEGLFGIHRSFKFCIVLFKKGGVTSELMAHFDSRNVREAELTSPHRLDVSKLKNFSPKWLSVPEVESAADLELLGKIGSNSIRFEEFAEEFDLKFRREFDMTNDSEKFILRDYAEQIGYRSDAHGRWIRGGDVALPLYEGRMLGQFDVAQKGWVHGKGRQALWLPVPDGRIMPQYLLAAKDYDSTQSALKVGFLGVGSATNVRSMIAACLGSYPCGNSVPTFHCRQSRIALLLTACLNSFVFDYVLRMRLVGNNLNYFILQESYLPRPDLLLAEPAVLKIVARLSYNAKHFAPQLQEFLSQESLQVEITSMERMRLRCILDALIADLYGLDIADLEHILQGCDTPQPSSRRKKHLDSRLGTQVAVPGERLLSPRGFWRVDKNRPAQARQTVLTLAAFKALKISGRQAFLAQNDFSGWEVPVEASTHF
ncbi:MAG: N-6 DNA methylase, partial [Candidatus Melainabacteria bacterium]|nr:N-6 DNA methylase [Candidatus Melainabacteria bacterium]